MFCDMCRARVHDSTHGQLRFECLVSPNRDACDLASIISQSTYRVLASFATVVPVCLLPEHLLQSVGT